VQDFTPTPMTLATEIYYSGYHPYTMEKVYTARNPVEKQSQRQFFFWYKREFRRSILNELKSIGRNDLVNKLFDFTSQKEVHDKRNASSNKK